MGKIVRQDMTGKGVANLSQESPDKECTAPRPRIVAAIPCYNEDRFIGTVVAKTRKFVDRVIVVDDGSTDASAEVACDTGAEVYRHKRNRGYGAAIRSGLERCKELGADIVVTLDADGQHDPSDIPSLIKPLLDGEADIVLGSRFLGKKSRTPLYRRLGQRVLTTATNLASGQKISDSQSGFRAFSSKALHTLDLAESGMSVSSEILLALNGCGLKVAEVPIAVSYVEKAKRSPFGHGLSVLTRIVVLFSLRQPLMLFGVPGIVLLAAGLVLGVRVLTIYTNTGELALFAALGTILLCLAGLLGLFAALMLQAMKELLRGGVSQLAREVRRHASGTEPVEEER